MRAAWLLCAVTLLASAAEAQIRIRPLPTVSTSSGPPDHVQFTVANLGDTPVVVWIASLAHRHADGRRGPLQWLGVWVDDVELGTDPSSRFTVPAHGSVRVEALGIEGFDDDEPLPYTVDVVLETELGRRVRGRARIGRGTRWPRR